jgi:sigma-B regulation protein RsbU (phosphoserine phosphatase)
MVLVDSQLTANDIMQAYYRDAPLQFLAAAFITVAILSGAYALIRRRFDPLLIFLAIFAYLYGERLRLSSHILNLGLPHNEFFSRLRVALIYLVPIPAFAFFEAAGFMGRRGKALVICMSVAFSTLVAGTLIFGPSRSFELANNILVIVALPAIVLRSHKLTVGKSDSLAVRIGLTAFAAGSLWDNVQDTLSLRSLHGHVTIEPYCFAVLLASLGYVAARNTVNRDRELGEVRTELELAKRIQLSILPAAFPDSEYFQVAARYLPMTSVAGDFYDFLAVDSKQAGLKQVGLLIADVSGHGVPAALIASMVKMAAVSQLANAQEPARLLRSMNEALCGNTQDQFVTAAYVYLDVETRQLRYAAAGHPPMVLLRRGQVTEISENGLILAILKDAPYSQRTQPIESGDRFVLYTDGILEAANAKGEFFGEANLYRTLQQTASLTAAQAADRIMAAVTTWARSQDDDLTVIVCDILLPA